jgi:hypothetical protein
MGPLFSGHFLSTELIRIFNNPDADVAGGVHNSNKHRFQDANLHSHPFGVFYI